MKQVHIVEGNTGEYSDYTSWFVAAYLDKSEADAHAQAAQEWFDERWNDEEIRDTRYETDWPSDNPYNPQAYCDYTGSRWSVVTVDLYEFFSEFKERFDSLKK